MQTQLLRSLGGPNRLQKRLHLAVSLKFDLAIFGLLINKGADTNWPYPQLAQDLVSLIEIRTLCWNSHVPLWLCWQQASWRFWMINSCCHYGLFWFRFSSSFLPPSSLCKVRALITIWGLISWLNVLGMTLNEKQGIFCISQFHNFHRCDDSNVLIMEP